MSTNRKRRKKENNRRRRKLRRDVLDHYFWVMRMLADSGGAHNDGFKEKGYPIIFQGLRDARIFVIDEAQYAAYVMEACRYLVSSLGEPRYNIMCPLTPTPPECEEEIKKWAKLSEEEQHPIGEELYDEAEKQFSIEVPENLPFDSVWISYGAGVLLDLRTINLFDYPSQYEPKEIRLLGHLIGRQGGQGFSGAFYSTLFKHDVGRFGARMSTDNTILWHSSYEPWTLQAIIEHINSFRTFIERDEFSTGDLQQQKAGEWGISVDVPMPFYVVKIRSKRIQEETRKTLVQSVPKDYSHRWDVRGHEKVKVQRGALPLKPELRVKLLKRGYSLYTLEKPSAEDAERLHLRGMQPKRPHEWVAVKAAWVESYIKGPEDKPYVPSIRLT